MRIRRRLDPSLPEGGVLQAEGDGGWADLPSSRVGEVVHAIE